MTSTHRFAAALLAFGTTFATTIAATFPTTAHGAPSDDDIRWDADGRATRHAVVAPGKVVEWCGRLAHDRPVAWRFEAGAALDFNIHYHEGAAVRMPEKRDAVSRADGTFTPAVDHDFCWMWTNRSGAAFAIDAALSQAN